MSDIERVKDVKNGLYRCARHRSISVWVEWPHDGEWVTRTAQWPPDRQADGTYTLRFTLVSKSAARKRHIATYGTDRQNWPYNPRRPKSEEDIAAWTERGLDEKGHRVR